MKLQVAHKNLSICRLEASVSIPDWVFGSKFFSVTRTNDELSLVCAADVVPDGVQVEKDWCAIKVQGPLDFSLTGILLELAKPLAEAGISIFAVSTFDTDYVLVRSNKLSSTIETLRLAGHEFLNLEDL